MTNTVIPCKNVEDFWRGSRGGTPPGFWTTTASVLLQVIEMKGDAKDTPVDQGVDHVDHPWPSPKQSVWRPLHSREATATSPVRIVVVADIPLTPVNQLPDQGTRGFHCWHRPAVSAQGRAEADRIWALACSVSTVVMVLSMRACPGACIAC